jgi:hypothetical protein
MIEDIPAKGFRLISGKRNPRTTDGGYWVQLRNGWVDRHGPWPAKGPRWIHTGDDHDIIAVRAA